MAHAEPVSLVAKNPYELRLDMGARISEGEVRAALASGDMGFLHSYTTGSAVDGPGVRVVAWTSGCMWRCRYCHNPDTWKIGNGLPVSVPRAVEELRKYAHGLNVMSGGFTLSGGEPLMQHRFAVKAAGGGEEDGRAHRDRNQRLLRRSPQRRGARQHRSRHARDQVLGRGSAQGSDRDGPGADARFCAAARVTRKADVDPVRAGARPIPTIPRSPAGSPSSRRGSATCSVSTCCPFTRWAVSSGRRWGCRTA